MELNLSMNTSDYECREYLASIRWKTGLRVRAVVVLKLGKRKRSNINVRNADIKCL